MITDIFVLYVPFTFNLRNICAAFGTFLDSSECTALREERIYTTSLNIVITEIRFASRANAEAFPSHGASKPFERDASQNQTRRIEGGIGDRLSLSLCRRGAAWKM